MTKKPNKDEIWKKILFPKKLQLKESEPSLKD
jgi:hypothetical protein